MLYNYIREYYQSYLFFDVKLLHYYANKLLQARVGPLPNNKKIEANWHIRFYQRYPDVKDIRARLFNKNRFINENPDEYIH
jgi:hypothetical protein